MEEANDIQIKVLTEQLMQAVDVESRVVQPPLASCETVEGTQASI